MNPKIDVVWIPLNLLDNESVRAAADAIKRLATKIHVVINNAGVMAVRNYTTSKQGVEGQFAANYLGHFLLTNLLMDRILAAREDGVTVVNVGSLGYELGEVNFDDINFEVCQNLCTSLQKPPSKDYHHRKGSHTMLGRHLGNQRPQCFSGMPLWVKDWLIKVFRHLSYILEVSHLSSCGERKIC